LSNPDQVHLLEMIDAAATIETWTRNVSLEGFKGDDLLRSAVGMQLIVLGEGARLLSDSAKARAVDVPWADITALRHRLAHSYVKANVGVLWEVATTRVGPLAEELRALLAVLPEEG